MKSAKLTTASSYLWTTSINPNATNESIVKYFLGQCFDVGTYPTEQMEKVVKVEIFGKNGELLLTEKL